MKTIHQMAALALLSCAMSTTSAQDASPPPASSATTPAPAPQAAKAPAERSPARDDDAGRVDAIRQYSYARREDALAAARRANAAIDQRLASLQADLDRGWTRASEATRVQNRREMERLRTRRTELAEWYGGLRHGSADAWAEVRTGFVDSYHAMADALRRARARLDQAPPKQEQKPAKSDQDKG